MQEEQMPPVEGEPEEDTSDDTSESTSDPGEGGAETPGPEAPQGV